MNNSLTDRYVRNKLSPDEVEAYELRMLDSPELQEELEEALILQHALKLDKTQSNNLQGFGATETKKGPNWVQWALAASSALILVSSYSHLTNWTETNLLKNQVADLSQPRANIIFATVKIMRSASNTVPDSIILLPDQKSTVMLEIELGSRSRNAQSLLFSFESENEPTDLSWVGSPDDHGLTTVTINSEQIPLGLVWLVVTSKNGEVLERRLLEFKASE